VNNYKVYPTTDHEDPEEVCRQRSTLFLTSGPDEGRGQSRAHGKRSGTHIVQEAGWVTRPVWTGEENLTLHRGSIPEPSSQ
jgi:hypothetical protein